MTAAAVCRTALSTTLLGVLSFLACQTAFGQEEFELVASDEPQRQLVEQIRAIHARDGVYAEGLVGPFSELARSYEQSGDYAAAVAALDRAAQLIRVNRGVHSLDQGPLLQQAIRGGGLTAAWDREADLLDLAGGIPRTYEPCRCIAKLRKRGWVSSRSLEPASTRNSHPAIAIRWCLAPVFGGR